MTMMMERAPHGAMMEGGGGRGAVGALTRFVRAIYSKGKVDRFELLQMTVSSANRIWAWKGEELEGRDPEMVADAMMNVIEEDANNLHGIQRYAILAYMSQDPGKLEGRHLLRMEGRNGLDDGPLGESEPPTAQGVTSQLMRHNEVIMRMAMGSQWDIMRMMKDEIMEMREMTHKIIPLQMRMMQTLEELYDNKEDREDRRVKRKMEFEREKKMMEFGTNAIAMLFPIVLKKLMGGSQSEVGKMLGEEQIASLLKTLGPDQLMEISKHLNPEQTVALMEIYRMFKEKEKAAEAPAEGGAK